MDYETVPVESPVICYQCGAALERNLDIFGPPDKPHCAPCWQRCIETGRTYGYPHNVPLKEERESPTLFTGQDEVGVTDYEAQAVDLAVEREAAQAEAFTDPSDVLPLQPAASPFADYDNPQSSSSLVSGVLDDPEEDDNSE